MQDTPDTLAGTSSDAGSLTGDPPPDAVGHRQPEPIFSADRTAASHMRCSHVFRINGGYTDRAITQDHAGVPAPT